MDKGPKIRLHCKGRKCTINRTSGVVPRAIKTASVNRLRMYLRRGALRFQNFLQVRDSRLELAILQHGG